MKKTQDSILNTCTILSVFLVFSIMYYIITQSIAYAQTDGTVAGQKKDQQTDSTNSVREKVRQTIENLVKKPQAVVGALDQITDSTLQIKGMNGKTLQVAATGDTKYIKTGKDKKDIKFQELALGNFIVALGYRNGNDILEAKRVLVYEAAPFSKEQVILGKVKEFSKNKMSLIRQVNNENWTINTKGVSVLRKSLTDNKLEKLTTNDIEIGDKIIVAGTLDTKSDQTIKADKIYIFPNQTTTKTSGTPSPRPKSSPTPKPSASPKATAKPTPTP